ncbi:hypothetical protein D9M71_555810 [compost metagenome]
MHAVFYGIAGSEEQHRHFAASCAYGLENLPAIAAGQHHIEDQQVVVAGQGQMLAGIAVGGQLRGKACFTEALAQVLAGLGLVFDDQQFHRGAHGHGLPAGYTAPEGSGGQADKVVMFLSGSCQRRFSTVKPDSSQP